MYQSIDSKNLALAHRALGESDAPAPGGRDPRCRSFHSSTGLPTACPHNIARAARVALVWTGSGPTS